MNNIEKLYERFTFYREAYEKVSKETFELEEKVLEQENDLNNRYFNLIDKFLGEDFSQEERQLLESHFGVNLIALDKKFKEIKSEYEKTIEDIKNNPIYKEYLEIVISNELEYAIKLENDEVFCYLIDENFHNNEFKNEPYFEILGLKYQPRFWKFQKFANKKAKEIGFKDYMEMFRVWEELRLTYESLIGDKKIEDVVEESKRLKKEINDLENNINKIPELFLQDIKKELVKILFVIDENKFNVFTEKDEVKNILSLRNHYHLDKKGFIHSKGKSDILLDNINKIEELISVVESGNVDISNGKFDALFIATDPTIPLFNLIPDKEWDSIKKALEKKGINTKNKENYMVVETKVTAKEKEEILNKFNVKEGDIFIDPSLSGKRHRI